MAKRKVDEWPPIIRKNFRFASEKVRRLTVLAENVA